MIKVFSLVILLFFLASSSIAVAAEAIWQARCGGKIIKPGLSRHYLINNCREPDDSETFSRGSAGRTAEIEKLYYYHGSHTYIVTVRNGTIESILKEPR